MQTVYGFYLAMDKGSVNNLCNCTDKRICSFSVGANIISELKEIKFIDEVNLRCNSICNEWDTDLFSGEQLNGLKTYLEELIEKDWPSYDLADFFKNLYLYVVFAMEHGTAVGFVL